MGFFKKSTIDIGMMNNPNALGMSVTIIGLPIIHHQPRQNKQARTMAGITVFS
jgi:hypothetical protein